MRFHRLLLICFCVLGGACSPARFSPPTTVTPLVVTEPQATIAPSSTPSLIPSPLPSRTPTPTPVLTPSPTPPSTPTESPLFTVNISQLNDLTRWGNINHIVLSPDGKQLAVVGSLGIGLYDVVSLELVGSLENSETYDYRLYWSPDSSKVVVSRSTYTGVGVWSVRNKRLLREVTLTASTWDLAWKPDGTQFAAGGSEVKIVDVASGRVQHTYIADTPEGIHMAIPSMAWSLNGKMLAAGSKYPPADRFIWIWDTTTGAMRHMLPITPSGQSPKIQNVAWKETTSLKGQFWGIPIMAWSPDSVHLAVIEIEAGSKLTVWNDLPRFLRPVEMRDSRV
jgi:WD40 repeat protein